MCVSCGAAKDDDDNAGSECRGILSNKSFFLLVSTLINWVVLLVTASSTVSLPLDSCLHTKTKKWVASRELLIIIPFASNQRYPTLPVLPPRRFPYQERNTTTHVILNIILSTLSLLQYIHGESAVTTILLSIIIIIPEFQTTYSEWE